MKKVGLYGGSFDPPTLGHIEVASTALEHLDEVVMIP
jgi:cytidyltransferase-like protein